MIDSAPHTAACPIISVEGLRDQGLGFRVQGLGFRVQGFRLRIQGLGFRVEGSRGLRVRWSFSG